MPLVYWPWVCFLFAPCYQLGVSTLPSPCHKFVQPSPWQHSTFSTFVPKHTLTRNIFINSFSSTFFHLFTEVALTTATTPHIIHCSLCYSLHAWDEIGRLHIHLAWILVPVSFPNLNILWVPSFSSARRPLILLPFNSFLSSYQPLTSSQRVTYVWSPYHLA